LEFLTNFQMGKSVASSLDESILSLPSHSITYSTVTGWGRSQLCNESLPLASAHCAQVLLGSAQDKSSRRYSTVLYCTVESIYIRKHVYIVEVLWKVIVNSQMSGRPVQEKGQLSVTTITMVRYSTVQNRPSATCTPSSSTAQRSEPSSAINSHKSVMPTIWTYRSCSSTVQSLSSLLFAVVSFVMSQPCSAPPTTTNTGSAARA
jgi:hypothetical protein